MPGHYTGTTSGGNHVQLDVNGGPDITRVFFDSVNGSCNLDYSSILPGGLTLTGDLPVNPDGSFSVPFQDSGTGDNSEPYSDTGSLTGRFSGTSVSGTISLNSDFYTEDGTHLTCSGTETWTATLSP